jgi:hypothetical protein
MSIASPLCAYNVLVHVHNTDILAVHRNFQFEKVHFNTENEFATLCLRQCARDNFYSFLKVQNHPEIKCCILQNILYCYICINLY